MTKQSEHSDADGHEHDGDEHEGHHDRGEEASGARYAEGKGITLLDETKEAMGLEVAEAEERKLAPVVPLEAQVYRAADEPSRPGGERSGSAYATAFVNPRLAERLKGGESATLKTHGASYEARVWRIDPVSTEAVNNVEAILQILDPQNTLKVGEFVSGSAIESGAEETVLTIPRSAVLDTPPANSRSFKTAITGCAPSSPSERRTRSMRKLQTGYTLAMSSSRSPSRPSISSSCAPPKAAGTLTKP